MSIPHFQQKKNHSQQQSGWWFVFKRVFAKCIHQERPGPTPKAGCAGSKPLGVPSRQNPPRESSEGFKTAYSPLTPEVEKVTAPGICVQPA